MTEKITRLFFRRLFLLIVLIFFILPGISGQEHSLLLDKIIINYDSVLYSIDQEPLNKNYSITRKYNNLVFLFTSDKDLYFSFFLDGYDDIWSAWLEYPVKEYTNLGHGEYTLSVRTGFQGRILSEDKVVSINVESPFLLGSIFLIIYLVILTCLIWGFYRLGIKRHIKRQLILEQLIEERTEELKAEKDRSESLLANVLPRGTADELMSKGKATKRKYNFVTVLFSDIQGFTKIAEEVNPEELIDELDKFFFHFDTVVEKYNIEKIKTIGDAYMCAGGIPSKNRTNPVEVILAALEMQVFMGQMKKTQKENGQIFWDIRIGLHTGTVVAGVIGQKKLSYDIWGDTVNIASRMESSGEAGKINISGTTYEYAREFFICEYRGKMPVKYKGELDMYFVHGIRPELRLEGKDEPNELFKNKMLMIRLSDLEDSVFEMYENDSSEKLVFHDIRYLKNITTQAELIGRAELLTDNEMLNLRLAALYMITGYVTSYVEFMDESLKLLNSDASAYGFSQEHIDKAVNNINDCYSDNPQTVSGMILSDSVYDYYGRVDFLIRAELLFAEESDYGVVKNKRIWLENLMEHLSGHDFKTNTGKLLRTNSVNQQIDVLRNYIDKI